MTREKTCTNPECSSSEARSLIFSKGLCQNCYQRRWRSRQKASKSDSIQARARAELSAYLTRNLPSLRLSEVQRLLDHGMKEQEIVRAFLQEPSLLELVEDLSAPVKAIKRDIAVLHKRDLQKTEHQCRLERQIRQTQDQLGSGRLAARNQATMSIHLHELERELVEATSGPSSSSSDEQDLEAQIEAARKSGSPPPDGYQDDGIRPGLYYDWEEERWDYRLPHFS